MGLQKKECGVLRFSMPEEVRSLVQVEGNSGGSSSL
jgi:hypothetical protein